MEGEEKSSQVALKSNFSHLDLSRFSFFRSLGRSSFISSSLFAFHLSFLASNLISQKINSTSTSACLPISRWHISWTYFFFIRFQRVYTSKNCSRLSWEKLKSLFDISPWFFKHQILQSFNSTLESSRLSIWGMVLNMNTIRFYFFCAPSTLACYVKIKRVVM
jgi:hypothetical protein